MALKKMSPFVKWAGGKKQLIEKIRDRIPSEYNTYYEPFVGGGAVLFELRPKKAVINDVNEQLINIYRQLKAEPFAVIREIKNMDQQVCNKELYLSVREKYNQKIQNHELDVECAGMMIWLNKHCFNGLYRVNNKGFFNVPYNNRKLGSSIDETNIMNIGYFLRDADVDIRCEDFEKTCEKIKKGDFVYFDSPYIPVSVTASFTDYTKDGFTYDDHIRLAKLFKRLDSKGVKCMLSNNDVTLVYELYNGYNIEQVDVKRNINSIVNKRVGKEVIIRNYD